MDTQLAEYLRSIHSDDENEVPDASSSPSHEWATMDSPLLSLYLRRCDEWTSSRLMSWCLDVIEAVRRSMLSSGTGSPSDVNLPLKSSTNMNHLLLGSSIIAVISSIHFFSLGYAQTSFSPYGITSVAYIGTVILALLLLFRVFTVTLLEYMLRRRRSVTTKNLCKLSHDIRSILFVLDKLQKVYLGGRLTARPTPFLTSFALPTEEWNDELSEVELNATPAAKIRSARDSIARIFENFHTKCIYKGPYSPKIKSQQRMEIDPLMSLRVLYKLCDTFLIDTLMESVRCRLCISDDIRERLKSESTLMSRLRLFWLILKDIYDLYTFLQSIDSYSKSCDKVVTSLIDDIGGDVAIYKCDNQNNFDHFDEGGNGNYAYKAVSTSINGRLLKVRERLAGIRAQVETELYRIWVTEMHLSTMQLSPLLIHNDADICLELDHPMSQKMKGIIGSAIDSVGSLIKVHNDGCVQRSMEEISTVYKDLCAVQDSIGCGVLRNLDKEEIVQNSNASYSEGISMNSYGVESRSSDTSTSRMKLSNSATNATNFETNEIVDDSKGQIDTIVDRDGFVNDNVMDVFVTTIPNEKNEDSHGAGNKSRDTELRSSDGPNAVVSELKVHFSMLKSQRRQRATCIRRLPGDLNSFDVEQDKEDDFENIDNINSSIHEDHDETMQILLPKELSKTSPVGFSSELASAIEMKAVPECVMLGDNE